MSSSSRTSVAAPRLRLLIQKTIVTQFAIGRRSTRARTRDAWWDNFDEPPFSCPALPRSTVAASWTFAAVGSTTCEQKLRTWALLSDGVHLNDQGNFLLAEIVKQYLVYRPELASDRWLGHRAPIRSAGKSIGRTASWGWNSRKPIDLIAVANSDGKALAHNPSTQEAVGVCRAYAATADAAPGIVAVTRRMRASVAEDWTSRSLPFRQTANRSSKSKVPNRGTAAAKHTNRSCRNPARED